MSIARTASRIPAGFVTRRLIRAWPVVGAIVALATVAGAIRRKGFLRGVADTALNAVPVLGTAKNLIEVHRGRDFICEAPARRQSPGGRLT
jgi:hypothetical protein